ncbi:MAG: CocE/NonD family hydrolase [Acidimicrobiia bacterium]|nr:CocE/NonD family hydrolase [Acidimicrobiia bacterium]
MPMSHRPPHRWRAAITVVAALTLVLAACTGDDGGGDGGDPAGASETGAPTGPPDLASIEVVGGTQEITLTGAPAGTPATLLDAEGTPIITLITDDAGQAHTGYVADNHIEVVTGGDNVIPTGDGESLKPGSYSFVVGEGDEAVTTDAVEVRAISDHPDQSFYDEQEVTGIQVGVLGDLPDGADLEEGFNYLEMRDGVLLSAMVRFPDPSLYGDGPYPTVIEYSGYDGIADPNGEQPGMLIARAMGYATVGVALRGTGCSGGAFDVFSPAEQADGYDVVEIVAAQPWVLGNQVGMVGLSYSGITQLYTAATNPPSLAAIVPQSVIVDPWVQQWPGGVYNDGFTRQWLAERDAQAAAGGMGWVTERIEEGDEICEANMGLRSQNIDFETFGRALEFRPDDAHERDLRELVRNIDVPVLLTGAFQDEQTGPLFPEMIGHFDEAPVLRVNMWNGRHPDGYSAMNIMAMHEFLELYVHDTVPQLNELVRAGLPAEIGNVFDVEVAELAPDRLHEEFGDDLEAARAAYEAEDPITVVIENGFGDPDQLGAPGGTLVLTFSSWPAVQVETSTWYLGPDGSLSEEEPSDDGSVSYRHDPDAGAEDFFADGYHLFPPLWEFDWTRFDDDATAVFLTEPFADDVVLGGSGELTLYISSDATDAAVQVTLSEVRPDGVEYLLQHGWLRLGHRKVDEARSRPGWVERTFARGDYEPLVPGEMVEARIPIPTVVAPLRAGSQLRVEVATPGRNHGTWMFESLYDDGDVPTHEVYWGPSAPSSLTMSILPGIAVPPGLPPCPALRGQPCRSVADDS